MSDSESVQKHHRTDEIKQKESSIRLVSMLRCTTLLILPFSCVLHGMAIILHAPSYYAFDTTLLLCVLHGTAPPHLEGYPRRISRKQTGKDMY